VEQLDFEFVLFASTVVDYDYIMTLIANYTAQEPSKQTRLLGVGRHCLLYVLRFCLA
jgi:hypothetical protein